MELPITQRHGKALNPSGIPPTDAPDWIGGIDNPYLHGVFAPVMHEQDSDVLEVEGELPRDLFGAYFRNGPNLQHAPTNRYHWFDGDGLVQGIWFEDGRARYRSRHVGTRAKAMEDKAGKAIWPGVLGPFDFSLPLAPIKDTANTDLTFFQGQLMALWYESGRVHAMDPHTLETRSDHPIAGLDVPVSAHSKVDPATGELLWFGYGDRPPYMRYGVVRPDGTVHQTEITLPGPRRPHDLGVTPKHSIVHDFPVFFDPEVFKKTGKRIPVFHREVPTRYGVLPRYGTDADVKWFEFEPCYMLHVVNCWEEGDEIVMVGCITKDPSLHPDPQDGKLAAMLSFLKLQANLHVWRMNLVTGETHEEDIDELNAEFPTIRDDWMGRPNRYTYLQRIPYESPATFDELVKADLQTGAVERYPYGPGIFGSEAPFAPRPGSTEEDDGYVVTFVTDANDWSSACWVFDARRIADGPVAKVKLPGRIPAGFHATWVPGAQLP